MRTVKQEVLDLCIKFLKSDTGSDEWEKIKAKLINDYGFTSWSLLALYKDPPTIEYDANNAHLVLEE